MSLDSLETALDLPITVSSRDADGNGVDIVLYGIRMRDLPRVSAAFAPVAEDLREGDVLKLVSEKAEAFVHFVAVAAGVDEAWLSEQDAGVLMGLLDAVRLLNAPLFEKPKPATSLKQKDADWHELFDALIAAGHDADKIPDYSLAQFHGYAKAAADRMDHQRRIDTVYEAIAHRAGGAGKQAFEKFVKDMQHGNA